jgi:hypothetical protein
VVSEYTKRPQKKRRNLCGFSEVLLCGYVTCCWNYVTQHPPGHLRLETGVWLSFSWTITELPMFYRGNTYHVNFRPGTMKVGK